MKISIITWDANFREKLHTIDCFANQSFDKAEFEFIWVDFYNSNDKVREKINQYENCRLLTLGHSPDESWHLGKCINEGVKASTGELVVLPDGDILVASDYLASINEFHDNQRDLLLYCRRYDESESEDPTQSSVDIQDLESRTKLLNPLNYAGCFSLAKELFQSLGGHEEHEAFSGPGMNAYELYIRARNSSASVKWFNKKIYHPWHASTGISSVEDRERSRLKVAREYYPWINPYSGLSQSWVSHCREMNLDTVASVSNVEQYLSDMPEVKLENLRSNSELQEENSRVNKQVLKIEDELHSIQSLWFVKAYLKLKSSVSNLM